MSAAVWCSRRRFGSRRWLLVTGFMSVWVCVLLPQAHADVALEGSRREPLFRQTTLQKWNTGAEICQSIHPARYFSSTQQLRERGRKMVAVFVHQVVGVPLELLSKLLHYFINVFLCKVCCAQSYSLFEFERFPQFWGISRVDFKNATEGIWMATIRKLSAVDLYSWVEDSNTQSWGVFINPVQYSFVKAIYFRKERQV